ncbi:MAG: patatin-like phospholipase family protein [Pseudomonadota bacterium]
MPLSEPQIPATIIQPTVADGSRTSKFEPNSVGLSCSGGGYKSGAFQLGAFIRLNETGLLKRIDRISSVSGGSIAAAFLGLRWHKLVWENDIATNFDAVIARPLSSFFTSKSIDIVNIVAGLTLPYRTGASGLKNAYRKHLFGDATLQDFPDPAIGEAPRFVILATDFELNTLWRFAKPYAANYRVGQIDNPRFSLASLVTASSAFPPFFCPIDIDLRNETIRPYEESDRHEPPYTMRMRLGDAGIYDNLGVEPIWKRCGVVLVSNAGDPFGEMSRSKRWSQVLRRSMSMMHRQAENNRMRWLHSLRLRGERHLADWHLRQDVSRFEGYQGIGLGGSDLEDAQDYAVRLKRVRQRDYELLVRHGYSMCSAALQHAKLMPNAKPAAWPTLA